MDEFPREVTTDILSRLAPRYIFQCRCVCKTWKKMIDDHRFHSLHFTRSLDQNSTFLIIYPFYNCIYIAEEEADKVSYCTTKIEFSSPTTRSCLLVTNPCNGFLGFTFMGSEKLSINGGIYINIYNPITRECVKLPHRSSFFIQYPFVHTIGLGLDPATNSFKVVLTLMLGVIHFQFPEKALVFTLGSDSWRELQNFPKVQFCAMISPVFVNGSLHWVTNDDRILSLNLTSELFSFIEIPQFSSPNLPLKFRLVDLGGCLCVFSPFLKDDIELWIMKEYMVNESWSKLVIIKGGLKGFSSGRVLPITLWKNGEIILHYQSGMLVSYEIETGKCTQLQINGLQTTCEVHYGYDIYAYVGNLMQIMPPRQIGE